MSSRSGAGICAAPWRTPSGPARPPRAQGIAFRVADTPLGQFLAAARGRAIHVAGHLRRDAYRGGDAVQLLIDDAAPAGEGSAAAAQQLGQFRDTGPVLDAVDGAARPRVRPPDQHGAGEFAELGADFRLRKTAR